MSVYEKQMASDNKDADVSRYASDDFVFVRHQTNTEVTKSEWEPTLKAMMSSDALEIADDRCIYENEEILVMHQVMTFPDGSREAVMIVDRLKDGKIIRTETGATPIQ